MNGLARDYFGPKFSEGSRLLWLAKRRADVSTADMTRALGAGNGMVHRWLFGDRRPDVGAAVKIEKAYGIKPEMWVLAPSRRFRLKLKGGVRIEWQPSSDRRAA
jgi:plasmid maintenance system antidote protein VapI